MKITHLIFNESEPMKKHDKQITHENQFNGKKNMMPSQSFRNKGQNSVDIRI